jgi:hypothetical protein
MPEENKVVIDRLTHAVKKGNRGILLVSFIALCLLLVGTMLSGARPSIGETGVGTVLTRLNDGKVSETTETTTPQDPPLSCLPRFSRPELQVEVPMVGEVPSRIFIADLNQDGLSDVFVGREEDLGGVALEPLILVNDGNEGLVDGTSSVFLGPVPKLYAPGFAVFEDFDQDGHLDMFITDGGRDGPPFPGGQNRLFLSAPGGKLVDATGNLPQQLDGPHGADGADIDGDGDVDLYVQSLEGPYGIGPELLLNDGTGVFSKGVGRLPPAQADPTQTSYTSCLFADVNEDGSPDLVLGSDISVDNVVLLNDGQGWFSLLPGAMPPKIWDPRDAALSIQATDLNGDQHLDLLVLYARNDIPYSNNNTGRYIQILIGNGDGAFRDETDTRLPQSPNRDPWYGILELIDFDYDGDLDIATRGRIWAWGDGPPFYLNDGQGYFTPTEPPVEIGPMGFLDLDGNGRRDVFFSNDPRGGVFPEQYFVMRDVGCPVVFLPLALRGEGTAPTPGITGVVNVYPRSWSISGWGWSPHETLSVDVYAPGGRLMDTFFAVADENGELDAPSHWPVPREHDWMTLVASSGGRATFQVKFPRATADPDANTIVGVAEPNVELEAGMEHPEGTWHGLATRAAADGSFSFDFSPLVDWEYGDDLWVGQYVCDNARINITRDSPEMTVLEPGQ